MSYANLLARTNQGSYLMQVRKVNDPRFKSGSYPYVFPGTISLFGGEIENEESVSEGFEREIQEELPGLKLRGKNRKKNLQLGKRS